MTKIELLEKVNDLNTRSVDGVTYWTVVVLYNWVIWKRVDNVSSMYEIVGQLGD